RDRTHRYLGLGLFAPTLLKLALWDVWQLPRAYQILVLIAVGALLLGASFLYARFGRRIVAMLRDGVGPAMVLVLMLGGAPAESSYPWPFTDRQPPAGVSAPGLYRFEVEPALYRHSRSANPFLGDVRLSGPDGGEVPYVLREVRRPSPPVFHRAAVV